MVLRARLVLSMLSPEEIRQGVSLKPFVGEEATFVSVCLEEPDKQSVMASSNDQRFARRLVFVGHNQVEGKLDGGFSDHRPGQGIR